MASVESDKHQAGEASSELHRRKRARNACQRCRLLKIKCDSSKPICRRCEGYDYTCVYEDGLVTEGSPKSSSLSWISSTTRDELRNRRSQSSNCKALLRRIVGSDLLNDDLRAEVSTLVVDIDTLDKRYTEVSSILNPEVTPVQSTQNVKPDDELKAFAEYEAHVEVSSPQGYLGRASDVAFFGLMREKLKPSNTAKSTIVYSMDDQTLPHADLGSLGQLPNLATIHGLVDSYFAAIHVCYPFMNEPGFRTRLDASLSQPEQQEASCVWLASLSKFRGLVVSEIILTNPYFIPRFDFRYWKLLYWHSARHGSRSQSLFRTCTTAFG